MPAKTSCFGGSQVRFYSICTQLGSQQHIQGSSWAPGIHEHPLDPVNAILKMGKIIKKKTSPPPHPTPEKRTINIIFFYVALVEYEKVFTRYCSTKASSTPQLGSTKQRKHVLPKSLTILNLHNQL